MIELHGTCTPHVAEDEDGDVLFFNFFQKLKSPITQRLLRHRTVHVLCRPRWLSKTAGVYLERSVFLSAGLHFQPTHPLI